MSKLGQPKDISTSSNLTYGQRTWDPEREKNLQPLSELMVAPEPYTRFSTPCPFIGFTVPPCHSALSLGPNISRAELVLPLLPPPSPPTPSGLIQNYSGHP